MFFLDLGIFLNTYNIIYKNLRGYLIISVPHTFIVEAICIKENTEIEGKISLFFLVHLK